MDIITDKRKQQILDLLKDIERDKDISIIHAVESGSRAWGFPSIDSDYDIRFIYHHPTNWYLSPFDKKDHIELEINDDLDAGGWDIGKSLRLLYKGNAVVHEWLNSPVVYRSNTYKHILLQEFAASVFKPTPAFHHYYSQVKKRLLEEKTRRNAKAFLYGFRSLMCAKWIFEESASPPVLFDTLVKRYLDISMQRELEDVLFKKSKGSEGDNYSIPFQLWQYCEEEYQHLSNSAFSKSESADQSQYETVFKDLITLDNL